MEINQIVYPSCPIESHASEPLSRLCVDQKCDKKDVICCLCQFEAHKNHRTLPIKHFLNKIKLQEFEESSNPLQFAKSLTSLKHQYFSIMANCRKQIIDELQLLETHGNLYFNRCEQALLNISNLANTSKVFTEKPKAKAFQLYFKKILELYSPDERRQFSLKETYTQLQENWREKQKKMNINLVNLMNDFKKTTKLVDDVMQGAFEIGSKLDELRWSETLKGAKIKIEGMIAEQTNMESSGQRFGLIQQALPLNARTRWGIKVKKFVGWVGIGICLKNSIKTANYHFNYTNIGHGSYLISTNGYSWSHSVKEFNSAFKTFQFTVNDIVYIEYDPKDGKLRFRKNQGPDKFELDIVPPPSGDAYHPCVNLCSTGDSVELICPGMPLS